MHRLRLAICIGLTIIGMSGCTPAPEPPDPTTPVKGTISLDGKPVPTGEIHFGALGVPPKVLTITDGAFAGDGPVGDNHVEVFIYEEGPPNPRYPDVPTKTNTVPAKYWGPNTVLKATIREDEPNEFRFEMTSK